MKGYKKILTFIMFVMVAFSGYLFGCKSKYDNVKLTSDKEEAGLTLYLNDGLNQSKPNSGEIVFSVSGLENGANNIKLTKCFFYWKVIIWQITGVLAENLP